MIELLRRAWSAWRGEPLAPMVWGSPHVVVQAINDRGVSPFAMADAAHPRGHKELKIIDRGRGTRRRALTVVVYVNGATLAHLVCPAEDGVIRTRLEGIPGPTWLAPPRST